MSTSDSSKLHVELGWGVTIFGSLFDPSVAPDRQANTQRASVVT
jgi:hypothetical protein